MFNPFKKKPAPAAAPETPEPPSSGIFNTDQRLTAGLSYQQRARNAVAMSIRAEPGEFETVAADGSAMDSNIVTAKMINANAGYVPIQQLEYYGSQGFIGWQQCAILSQNWLISKACTMPAQDAVRHGYDVTVNDGEDIDPKVFDAIRKLDKKMNIKGQCSEFVTNARIFGIRHALFLVDGINYELPFNPDGVLPGSYKGIAQIDPYWLAPELDADAAANPADPNFYEPTWWRVNGQRVHRSHFVIMRNGEKVPDILKPSYIYGGIPITQKIYERVYASERTANEAPMLAMTKRLTVFKTDLTAAKADQAKFNATMEWWTQVQNNFGIKVIGEGDVIEQFDIGLADLDATIMTQYQLVAAASNVPATKLLGTTPKGFNATGEYEESSYHEELESIQENNLTPLLDRHHTLLIRSYIAPRFKITPFNTEISWLPVDSPTAEEVATTNKTKADTDKTLLDAGAIDGFDIRQRLINDRDSGYNGIADIIPGGPGDRVAEQERNALELEKAEQDDQSSAMDLGLFDPARGTINGARIITHQRYIDDAKVLEKIAEKDFVVNLTPEFEDEGKKYRMVIDGHHSLAAALLSNVCPVFVESVPRDVVFNPVTGAATDGKDSNEA